MNRLFSGTPFDIPPTCEICGVLLVDCQCTWQAKQDWETKKKEIAQRLPPEKQTAVISLQKRKGGRVATVIEGLTAKANDLPEVFKKLQSGCGSGGCVKPGEDLMELQGDHREKVKLLLSGLGFRVKERR